MENGKKKILIIAIVSLILILLVGGYFVITKVILNNEETEPNKNNQSGIEDVENLDIEMTIGDEIDLTNYIGSSETITETKLSDSSLFLLENNKIKSLSEGTTTLIVTYTDGTTKVYTLRSVVETSNSVPSTRDCSYKLYMKNDDNTNVKLSGYNYLMSDGYMHYNPSNSECNSKGYPTITYANSLNYTTSTSIPLPVKSGNYKFAGFYTGKGGTGVQVITASGKLNNVIIVSDMTLYAKWLKVGSGSGYRGY